jgi:putative nucleotide binding protein
LHSRGDYPKRPFKPLEEEVIVLDVLPYGDPIRGIRSPLIQTIGVSRFLLIELRSLIHQAPSLKPLDLVSLSSSLDGKILAFGRYLAYEDLTATAKSTLPDAIALIVKSQEKRFVNFFNNAQPLSKKAHTLELLKGIGKKTLWTILEERRKKPFESYDDIKKRVDIDPVKLIVERILDELRNPQTIYLFVNPPYGPSPKRSFEERRGWG